MPYRRALVLTALAAGACAHSISPTPPRTPAPLRVMTFNIRLDTPKDGDNVWANRKPGVLGMLPFYGVDLVGFQEVLQNQRADLQAGLPEYTLIGHGRLADRGGEGVYIAYRKERLELIEQGSFWLSPPPEAPGEKGWDAAYPRITVWAKLRDRMSGGSFHAFNTHLDNKGSEARLGSAKLIMARIGSIAGKRPVVLTGDFNARPDSPPYAEITAGGVLKDARLVSRRPPYPFSDTGTSTGFESPPKARGIIDYIFVTPTAEVRSFGVITENWDLLFPSDHRPVIAEVMLR